MQILDLGLTEYTECYRLQQDLATQRHRGEIEQDVVLVTEHHPVFTLGRRGGRENLMVAESFLAERGVQIVHIERGGDITYHGPGQLVIYPILHLKQAGLRVAEYVNLLEELMLRLASHAGVTADRDERNHGIWVKNSKLGSIGIAIRHSVSFHGLALNCNLSLEPFGWVNPCGLTGVSMTSLQKESGQDVGTKDLKPLLADLFQELFGRKITLDGLVKSNSSR